MNVLKYLPFKPLLAHATKVPGLIFLSGQTPVDIQGVVVPGGIKEHTVRDKLCAPFEG